MPRMSPLMELLEMLPHEDEIPILRPSTDELFKLARLLDERGMTKEADRITRSMVRTAQNAAMAQYYPQPIARAQTPTWAQGVTPMTYGGQNMGQMTSQNQLMSAGPSGIGAIDFSSFGVGRGSVGLNRGGGYSESMGGGTGLVGGMTGQYQVPMGVQRSYTPGGGVLLGNREVGANPWDVSGAALRNSYDQNGNFNPAAYDAMMTSATGGASGQVSPGEALESYRNGTPIGPWGGPYQTGTGQTFTRGNEDFSQLDQNDPMQWGRGNAELSGAAQIGMARGTWQGTGMTPQQQQQYAADTRTRNMMQPMGGGQQMMGGGQQMNPYQQAVSNYYSARNPEEAKAAWNQAAMAYGNMDQQQQQQMWNYYGTNQGAQSGGYQAPTQASSRYQPPNQAPQTPGGYQKTTGGYNVQTSGATNAPPPTSAGRPVNPAKAYY